jgi:hypothetical protein
LEKEEKIAGGYYEEAAPTSLKTGFMQYKGKVSFPFYDVLQESPCR